jgi:STIMATE family
MRVSYTLSTVQQPIQRWQRSSTCLVLFLIILLQQYLQPKQSTSTIWLVRADDGNNNNDNNSNGDNNNYSTYYDGSDSGTCMIYDKNDFFTVAVQLTLAIAAIASLWIKRLREHPQRTLSTWFYDVSKQGIGACYAHVMNMTIAAVISENIRGDNVLEDQCAWYGLSYLIDTTIGLLLAILGLQAVERMANRYHWKPLQHSGVYVGDTALCHWFSQVMAWMIILTITKLIIYLFMWLFSSQLAWIGSTLFAPFTGYKHFELLFVMIFFPGVLNVIYFWIADSYLKATDDQVEAHVHDESGLQDKKESLLSSSENDNNNNAATEMTTKVPTWSALSSNKNDAGTAAVATSAAV